MHDLLHTSTSCHFKVMFKESHYWDNGLARPYCGVLGAQFDLTPLQKMMERGIVIQQPNVLGTSSGNRLSISD